MALVNTRGSMTTLKTPSKVPLITTVILLILLVAGTSYDLRMQKAQQAALTANQSSIKKAETIAPVQTNRLIKAHGYRVIVPFSYKVKEEKQNGTVSSLTIVKQGADQQMITISRTKTQSKDPCLKSTKGFPFAKCNDISEYRMLDWGTEYRYTVIEGGYEYELNFQGVPQEEKDTIIATFKLT